MGNVFSSLLFRVAALFLVGLVALQFAILMAAMWPDGRPVMFRLVDPQDASEIAEAVERAPPELRPAIVAAVSTGSTTVELLRGFPEGEGPEGEGRVATHGNAGERPAPRLEERFRLYAQALQGRPIRVQVRKGTIFSHSLQSGEIPRGPIRILVGLRTGEVLAIERAPIALQQLANRYLVVAGVAAGVCLLLLLMLLWQVVRPIARLAQATRAFRENIAAPDAAIEGAREVRALAEAFNAMKHRISGLIGDRTRMLAAIAHDLRTYLTRLRLRADHIADDRHRARSIEDIEEMGRLLDDILLFARSDAILENEVPEIDVREETFRYIETRRETGDDVEVTAGSESLPCRCSPLTFRRILANLIDNAIRYGTRARVSLESRGTTIELAVTDEGPGIAEELI
ncbi:MAG: hypothetical protein BGO57_01990, partial [Sphingomonadales bacterium 63-6]